MCLKTPAITHIATFLAETIGTDAFEQTTMLFLGIF